MKITIVTFAFTVWNMYIETFGMHKFVNKIRNLFLFGCFIFCFEARLAFGQGILLLHVKHNDSISNSEYEFKDSIELSRIIAKHIQRWREDNYFTVGVDSILNKNDSVIVQINTGRSYESQKVTVCILDEKYKTKNEPAPVNIFEANIHLNQLLISYQNAGFPLAHLSYQVDEHNVDSIIIQAQLRQGKFYSFGLLDQRLGIVTNPKFLSHYLHIKPGKAYNQSLLDEISIKLQRLNFLAAESNSRVQFYGDEADIWLYLVKKPVNTFDILLGVAQNPTTTSKRYQITGLVKAEFTNALKWAETISFNYENLQDASPRLKTYLSFPYIRVLPIGLSHRFELYKSKTDFLLIKNKLESFYQLNWNQKIGLVLDVENNSLLNIDTAAIVRSGRLPPNLDYGKFSLGINYTFNTVNNSYNPSKGNNLFIECLTGKNQYKENPLILQYHNKDRNLAHQYDSLNNNQDLLTVVLNYKSYQRWSKRNVIKLGLKHQSLSLAKISNNQKFRLGGYNSLRGFDEESFLVTSYFQEELEYRFLLDQFSHLNIFFNIAQISSGEAWRGNYSNYYGFGTGFQFKTGIGFFNLILAMGTNVKSKLDFNTTKVHFGYSSLF